MNIALPTIIIIFLLVPGIIFRRFYYTEEFSKEYFKVTFGNLLLSTLFPSLIIHLFVLLCFVYPLGNTLDFDVIGTLLSGLDDKDKLAYAFENIYENKLNVIGYFILVGLMGLIAGTLSKAIIRNYKIDRTFKLFRFQNEWHYLFSGEILDFPRVNGEYDDIQVRYVDALVNTSEGLILYMGVLSEYVLSKENGIDRIYLSDVIRRKFKDDKVSDEKFENKYYKLPGEFFVIPYEKILNLHISYYKVDLVEVDSE